MMKSEHNRSIGNPFESLRRFARKSERALEHCQLCRTGLDSEHPHLIELAQRKLVCTCEACAMLFSGRSGAKYRRVPRRVRQLVGFHLSDAEWDGLLIPINLAFFFRDSRNAKVSALYPSPAGATESLLPLEAWNNIVQVNPALSEMEDDVEALLVNRVGHARQSVPAEYYIVPIDVCYRLVGLIRIHWRGLSGGTEVWQEIGKFFAELRAKAEIPAEALHA
jgi:Family of unknown function (DUF5947)